MNYAFADIHGPSTEPTAALPIDQILTLRNPSEFGASAKHSRRERLLALASPYQAALRV
jgi:hypothetical protein